MDLPRANCAQLFLWPSEMKWSCLCLRGEKWILLALPLVLSPGVSLKLNWGNADWTVGCVESHGNWEHVRYWIC